MKICMVNSVCVEGEKKIVVDFRMDSLIAIHAWGPKHFGSRIKDYCFPRRMEYVPFEACTK